LERRQAPINPKKILKGWGLFHALKEGGLGVPVSLAQIQNQNQKYPRNNGTTVSPFLRPIEIFIALAIGERARG
jgi:hypothetical protein